ncbi:MAG TPA: hypothetical protein VGA56_00270 [Opitutaceae bacterium]
MKLQLKAKAPAKSSNWHPSFRADDRLPDLKVVRTSFFINIIFFTAAAGAILFTAYREYIAISLRSDTQKALARIEAAGAQNSQFLSMSNEFSIAAKKFTEIEKFRKAPFQSSELLVALSRTLPATIDFTTVTYNKDLLMLRGSIRGASDTASARLTAYLDILRQEALIGGVFPDISLTSLLRDPRTQGLSFEIILKPDAAARAAKKST